MKCSQVTGLCQPRVKKRARFAVVEVYTIRRSAAPAHGCSGAVQKRRGAATAWCSNGAVQQRRGAATAWCNIGVVQQRRGVATAWCSKGAVSNNAVPQRCSAVPVQYWCSAHLSAGAGVHCTHLLPAIIHHNVTKATSTINTNVGRKKTIETR